MDKEEQIPGNWTIAEWQPEPLRPLKVVEATEFRNSTALVIIHDSAGTEYKFGFDSFLGRLFAGACDERDSNVAWVVANSPLEVEFSVLVRAAVCEQPEWDWLTRYLERALSWKSS